MYNTTTQFNTIFWQKYNYFGNIDTFDLNINIFSRK